MQIKICGVRSVVSAKAAVYNGASFLGLNFIPRSPRKISPVFAKQIVDEIRGQVKLVGVFQNQKQEDVNKIAEFLNLDYIQLHGEEDGEYIETMSRPVIKAFQLDSDFDITALLKIMNSIKSEYFLLDRKKQSSEMLNLKNVGVIAKSYKVFVAGGLNPQNVDSVIKQVRPFGVDVASGIESGRVEDLAKIKQFIERAKNA
jgi:phosphoribosylanthranilate isomerase